MGFSEGMLGFCIVRVVLLIVALSVLTACEVPLFYFVFYFIVFWMPNKVC